ncbi:LytTR family transcriptional regulator DNA-binding domain-containing protein [Geofilum sp. OHC36d9]|uniref:LytTR family transcriptional regulator DNA-binding domain-containing protein n=1 Tax=Geofilum sp. OHC36d9 TaxID=3458413 RepID=UPI00403366C1
MSLEDLNILFVVGNAQSCFGFCVDNRVIEMQYSLFQLYDKLKEQDFIRINGYTIINTKYFIDKKQKRHIILKGGSIHKVSRNFWKHFNGNAH